MTRLIVGFTHDLVDPASPHYSVGVIRVQEDRFVSFEWTMDVVPLMTDPFTSEVLRTFPEIVFLMATDGWEECRAYQWDGRGTEPPRTLVDYLCRNMRHSNLYVSRIVEDEPVRGDLGRVAL
jgi:hypothetical protein